MKGTNIMRKNIKTTEAIFPMPVLMIATYNEDGSVNVMNAAWGMMLERNQVILNLTETHKTVILQLKKKPFCRHTAGISGEFPAGPYDSVTRYENRNRICRNSTGNSPCTVRYSDNFRKFFVCHGSAERYFRKTFPDSAAKWCSCRRNLNIEPMPSA